MMIGNSDFQRACKCNSCGLGFIAGWDRIHSLFNYDGSLIKRWVYCPKCWSMILLDQNEYRKINVNFSDKFMKNVKEEWYDNT
jgi:hypothetical protein